MRLNYRVGLEYELTVLDGATRQVVRRSGVSPNLVTDIGLDRIGAASVIGGFCRIGTGTTAPANSDTQLVSQSAATSTTVGSLSRVNAGAPNYETTATVTFEFPLGAVVGNMAEIGLGWASSGATLFSRARILDGGGSPTTITVLVTEILQVTARLALYPTLTDATGTVTLSGVSYGYTARVSLVNTTAAIDPNGTVLANLVNQIAYNSTIGAVTAQPAGSSTNLTSGTLQAYTNGTYYRDYTLTAALAIGNLSGGIKSIYTSLGVASSEVFRTQIEFGTAIPKDNTKTFSLSLRVSWARH